MKNLKNMMAAVLMVAVLMIGATSAKAGILLSDFAPEAGNGGTCGQTTDRDTVASSENTGIIVMDFTGIIVMDFTGIIVMDLVGSQNSRNQSQCRDGMLLSD
jgi:hypothetical protein